MPVVVTVADDQRLARWRNLGPLSYPPLSLAQHEHFLLEKWVATEMLEGRADPRAFDRVPSTCEARTAAPRASPPPLPIPPARGCNPVAPPTGHRPAAPGVLP